MVKLLASIVMLMTLLVGCTTVPSDALPPLKTYSRENLTQTGIELDSIRTTKPYVVEKVTDYGILRDQIRAGRKIK